MSTSSTGIEDIFSAEIVLRFMPELLPVYELAILMDLDLGPSHNQAHCGEEIRSDDSCSDWETEEECDDAAEPLPNADKSGDPYKPTERAVTERTLFSCFALRRIELESAASRQKYWAMFCAAFLPAAIDKILANEVTEADAHDPVAVFRTEFDILRQVQESLYFVKYLRSSHPSAAAAKQLPSYLARHMLRLSLHSEDTDPVKKEAVVTHANVAVGVLITILSIRCKEPGGHLVPDETRTRLVRVLKTWEKKGIIPQLAGRWCAAQMDGNAAVLAVSKNHRRQLGHLDKCSHPDCEAKTDLRKCNRCQTTRYCSTEHQRQHWKFNRDPTKWPPHKEMCFETTF